MPHASLPITDHEAHALAVSVYAADFARGSVDWGPVGEITGPLMAVIDVPQRAKPKAAAAAVGLMRRSGGGLTWRGQRLNLETITAIFDVLSDGAHRGGCPGAERGHHEWAAAAVTPAGTPSIQIPPKNKRCQRCGLQG
jgi:hypothetical protein